MRGGLDKWWNSDEGTKRHTEKVAKMFRDAAVFGEGKIKVDSEGIEHIPYEPFFGTDRTVEATRFTRPCVDERKWYQKINWLQRLARHILVD